MGQGGSLARLVLLAAVFAGFSYIWPVVAQLNGPLWTLWKGAGVGLLAVWCVLQARSRNGWLIAAVMALGAAGDVLLETNGVSAGAAAFLTGHVVAIGLYLRNLRLEVTPSQISLAVLVVPFTLFLTWNLTRDGGVTLYALFLSVMAATAWISRFPRYRTGIGAMLFVASDLLIFARMGALAGTVWISPAIWLLYFCGQLLIALGVVKSLVQRS